MSEVFEHNIGDHEDPLPGPTWIIGILGVVLLSIIILGVTALFFNADTRMVDEKVTTQGYPQFESLKKEQLDRLAGPPRIVVVKENDKDVETVVIPIDDAMKMVADRSAKAQAGASGHASAANIDKPTSP
jgi:hypothetical protein